MIDSIIRNFVIIVIAFAMADGAHADAPPPLADGQKEFNSSNAIATNYVRPLIFVQITDVHICDAAGKKILEKLIGREGKIDPEPFVNATVKDIVDLHPDFVVATGDLVVEARGTAPRDILGTYKLYNRSMLPIINAGIPFYPVIGNHDVVGVFNKSVDVNESGYGRSLFQQIFNQNSTYYSFDEGGYHFIALDPNSYELWNATTMVSSFLVGEQQMAWLEADLNSTSKPTIVFLHEPTVDLINRDELLGVLRAHNVKMIFSGHWHVNDLLDSGSIPEQVTTALSGAWWMGTDITGVPGGYMVVALNGSDIDTFYRYTGISKQINVIEPAEPVVNKILDIKAQIWSDLPVQSAWLILDGGQARQMNLTRLGPWYEAQDSIDLGNITQGYHMANITASEENNSTITKSFSFKVTDEAFVPIGEMLTHWETYLGKHPRIKGYANTTFDLTTIEAGMQPVFRDDTGMIPYVLGYCPPLPTGENDTQWMARGLLEKYDATKNTSVFVIQRDEDCPVKVAAEDSTDGI
jgi:hypothetical protein